MLNRIICVKNKIVQMSIQKTVRIKKIESNFDFAFVGQRFKPHQAIQHDYSDEFYSSP